MATLALVMDPVLWVLITNLAGTRIGRMLKEPSLKTETDRTGELGLQSQKRRPWAGIMELLEDPPVSGVAQVVLVNHALVMVMVQDGDHLQLTNLHKAAAGDRALMGGHNKHQEHLSGKMTVLLWVGDLMMVQAFGVRRDHKEDLVDHPVDGKTCPYQTLGLEDLLGQGEECHQDLG